VHPSVHTYVDATAPKRPWPGSAPRRTSWHDHRAFSLERGSAPVSPLQVAGLRRFGGGVERCFGKRTVAAPAVAVFGGGVGGLGVLLLGSRDRRQCDPPHAPFRGRALAEINAIWVLGRIAPAARDPGGSFAVVRTVSPRQLAEPPVRLLTPLERSGGRGVCLSSRSRPLQPVPGPSRFGFGRPGRERANPYASCCGWSVRPRIGGELIAGLPRDVARIDGLREPKTSRGSEQGPQKHEREFLC
jgi:hypothetical protein